MLLRILGGLALLLVLAAAVVYAAGRGWFGQRDDAGEVTATPRPMAVVRETDRAVAQAAAAVGQQQPKQILFGDLHVHTTLSADAFVLSLPALGGEGAHPPADACDFARFCSALDFWSINDHAFSLTPERWADTVESIRQCNDVAGDPANPDTVAYLGWEWTQVGTSPADHYGHKNVVLRHTDDANIPARPIAALGGRRVSPNPFGLGLAALAGGGRSHDLANYLAEWNDTPICEDGVAVRDLPAGCIEQASTPDALYDKLDDWGHDSIVIPHGTTWGYYTPPGSTWDKQLAGDMHDPERQTLFEIYSGHGDSEVYRPWRALEFGNDGSAVCPRPTPNHLPACWQAGEIIRERCLAEASSAGECEQRAVEARAHAAAAGTAVHRTVPGSRAEDFLDAGQCRDCREPSFNYRPGGAAQYVLALSNFDEGVAEPRRFRMGFMASSDNHFARPGTGFKEKGRRGNTESGLGRQSERGFAGRLLGGDRSEEPRSASQPFVVERPGFDVFETERQNSFFTTGGLTAVHSEGRDRDTIWQALQRKEVYGTSGPRILLWFELLNPSGSTGAVAPMGAEVSLSSNPIFRVRAVGSFEQRDGCPDYANAALDGERLDRLCQGECYHPSDRRRRISRIEVVRVRPQTRPNEDVSALIEDPWRTLTCEPDPSGCSFTFADTEFRTARRDAVYYVRAFETPAPAINADNLRCERDADGACTKVNPCQGEEDCLAEHEPRAWSSPIFVDYTQPAAVVSP